MQTTRPINSRREGAGPPVLLLHPIGLDLTFWDAVAARLSEQYSVLRADMRGHGQSPPAEADARLEDYAADIHRLLIDEAFSPCAVVGLSFGGMLAQSLALSYPQDVAALVLSGCTGTFPPQLRQALRARGAAARHGGMEAVVEETLQRWFSADFLAAGKAEATRQRLLANDIDGWAIGWNAISHHDAAPHLGSVKVPTLCLAGENDAAAPPAALQALADAIPGAQFDVLPAAPHMMHVECPRAFAEIVIRFLRDAYVPAPG